MIPVKNASNISEICSAYELDYLNYANMYADWSSLTIQLQSLGSATQSVLSKLPQDDGKQVFYLKFIRIRGVFRSIFSKFQGEFLLILFLLKSKIIM